MNSLKYKSKNIRIRVFIFFLIFYTSSIVGQTIDYETKVGNAYSRFGQSFEFLADLDEGFVIRYKEKGETGIALFDEQLNFIKSKEIDFKYQDDDLHEVAVLYCKGLLTIFGERDEEEIQAKVLYYYTMNLDDFSIETEWTKIAESKYIDHGYQADFFIKPSENNKYFFIAANQMFEEDIVKHLSVILYNENMEAIGDRTFELPFHYHEFGEFGKKGVQLKNLYISNSGKVFLFGDLEKEVLSEREIKGGKVQTLLNTGTYVFTFNFTDTKISSLQLSTPPDAKVISNLVKFDKNNNLIIAGYYLYEELNGMHGSFFYKIDDKLNIAASKYMDFSNEYVLDGRKPNSIEKRIIKDYGVLGMLVHKTKDLHISDSDKIYLVGEFFTYSRDGYGAKGDLNYVFGNIIISVFDTHNDTIFNHRINKMSETRFDFNFGCLSTVANNNLYLFFNDNSKNDFKTVTKEYYYCNEFSNLSTFIVELNYDESIVRNKLDFNNKNTYYLRPPFIYNRSGNILLYYTLSGDSKIAEVNFSNY